MAALRFIIAVIAICAVEYAMFDAVISAIASAETAVAMVPP